MAIVKSNRPIQSSDLIPIVDTSGKEYTNDLEQLKTWAKDNIDAISGDLAIAGTLTNTGKITASGGIETGAEIKIVTNKKIEFRDTGLYLQSSTDGQLDIIADGKLQLTSPEIAATGRFQPSVLEIPEGTAPTEAVAAAVTTDLDGTNDIVYTAKTKGVSGNSIEIDYRLEPEITVSAGDDLFKINLPSKNVTGTTIPTLTITQAATEAPFIINTITRSEIDITLGADASNDPIPILVSELETALESEEAWDISGYEFTLINDATVPAVAVTNMDSIEAITTDYSVNIVLGTTGGTIDSDVASILALIGAENALVTAAAKDGTDAAAINDVGKWDLIGGVDGTVAAKGKFFFDADFRYLAIDDCTVSESNFVTTLVNPKFAEITIDDNSTETAIDTVSTPHAIVNTVTEQFATGFTTKQGKRTSLEAIGGNGTDDVEVEATAHGCVVGDIVTITGTNEYNGAFIVATVVNANNLTLDTVIDEAAESAAGAISIGSQIISSGNWGHKRVTYSLSATPKANSKAFMFQLLIWKESSNTLIACEKCKTRTMSKNATEYFNLGAAIIMNWETGDRICLAVTGETDDTDLTIAEADICVI